MGSVHSKHLLDGFEMQFILFDRIEEAVFFTAGECLRPVLVTCPTEYPTAIVFRFDNMYPGLVD